MKKSLLKELHNKTVDELKRELRDKKNEFLKLTFESGANKLKNTASLKLVRKHIAVIKTILHMKMEGVKYGK